MFPLRECVKFTFYRVCVCGGRAHVCAVLLLLIVSGRRVCSWCGCSSMIFIPISKNLFTWLRRFNEIHTDGAW